MIKCTHIIIAKGTSDELRQAIKDYEDDLSQRETLAGVYVTCNTPAVTHHNLTSAIHRDLQLEIVQREFSGEKRRLKLEHDVCLPLQLIGYIRISI